MAYRDDVEGLQSRCAQIEMDLAEIRRQTRSVDDLTRREVELARDLREARERLERSQRHWSLPMLEDLPVATPCDADWDAMQGDERVRFCGGCRKHVYNLSAMNRDEAQHLLAQKEGPRCARLARRADGTVLTEDCPVGARKKRRRRLLIGLGGGILAAGVMMASALIFLQQRGGHWVASETNAAR